MVKICERRKKKREFLYEIIQIFVRMSGKNVFYINVFIINVSQYNIS